MWISLRHLFSSRGRIASYILLTAIASAVWWYFTDVSVMFGNYGYVHTYFDMSLSGVMVLGFPLFLVAVWYRGSLFGARENISGKTGIGTLGGVIGTVLSGCSCCGLTLASYVGLLPLMSILPYSGLEIKVVGVAGLLYALWDILQNLETCKVKGK